MRHRRCELVLVGRSRRAPSPSLSCWSSSRLSRFWWPCYCRLCKQLAKRHGDHNVATISSRLDWPFKITRTFTRSCRRAAIAGSTTGISTPTENPKGRCCNIGAGVTNYSRSWNKTASGLTRLIAMSHRFMCRSIPARRSQNARFPMRAGVTAAVRRCVPNRIIPGTEALMA